MFYQTVLGAVQTGEGQALALRDDSKLHGEGQALALRFPVFYRYLSRSSITL